MHDEARVAVASSLTSRLLAGDVDGVAALYRDDAVIWRNIDGRELVKKQMLKVVAFLASEVTDLSYTDVRVQPTASGFVQQHTLRGVAPNGQPVTAHACLVATLEEGLIVRLEEYLDSAALAPLMD